MAQMHEQQPQTEPQSAALLALFSSREPVPLLEIKAEHGHMVVRAPRRTGGGKTLVELDLNIGPTSKKVSYPVPANDQHNVNRRLASIQRQYLERVGPVYRPLAAGEEDTGEVKNAAYRLFEKEVGEVLLWQTLVDAAATLHHAAGGGETGGGDGEPDAGSDEVLGLLSEAHGAWLSRVRRRLRNDGQADSNVRKLLRSGVEWLVGVGLGLAAEPALRPLLQDDLVDVYTDQGLARELRRRAFSTMREDTRAEAERRLADRPDTSPPNPWRTPRDTPTEA